MKTKKFNKKLSLNKKTISNLNYGQMRNVNGGGNDIVRNTSHADPCGTSCDTQCNSACSNACCQILVIPGDTSPVKDIVDIPAGLIYIFNSGAKWALYIL